MKKILFAGALASAAIFLTGCEHKVVYINTPTRTTCTSFGNQIDCDNPKSTYFYTKDRENDFPVTYKKSYTKKCKTIEVDHIYHHCCKNCK